MLNCYNFGVTTVTITGKSPPSKRILDLPEDQRGSQEYNYLITTGKEEKTFPVFYLLVQHSSTVEDRPEFPVPQ